MFGDPSRNPRQWRREYLGDLVAIHGGGTPSKQRSEFWNGDIPWISPKDVRVPRLRESALHVTQSALDEAKVRLLPPDTILVVVRGMRLIHTVPICLTQVPVTINQDLKALVPKEALMGEFLLWCLESMHAELLSLVTIAGHGARRLETDKLLSRRIPVPPRALQKKFLDRARQAQAIIDYQNDGDCRANQLFAALLDNSLTRRLPADW